MKKLKKTTKNKSINSVAEKFTIKAKPAVAFATAGFFSENYTLCKPRFSYNNKFTVSASSFRFFFSKYIMIPRVLYANKYLS